MLYCWSHTVVFAFSNSSKIWQIFTFMWQKRGNCLRVFRWIEALEILGKPFEKNDEGIFFRSVYFFRHRSVFQNSYVLLCRTTLNNCFSDQVYNLSLWNISLENSKWNCNGAKLFRSLMFENYHNRVSRKG